MSADAHRWGSAVAVAVVVVAFLAGLPLLELATTPEPARPGDDLPWNDRLSRAAVGTVTIEPAAGWTVATTGDGTPGLRNGAATFVVQRQVGDGCS
ncbi:MAG TPA: hypothetical protein DEQ43_16070, partial [Nocardioides bacterium]|nr:hypothetical protein [Nocardioides sp.]